MTARNILQAAAGTSGKTYVDDVFSTYLYNGNGTSQTINNGIDLAGKGGMTWIKQRSGAVVHRLQDTTRGAGQSLVSSTTGAAVSEPTSITSFAASGFVLGANTGTNTSGQIFASWTFRNAPKFFTHTTVSHTNGTPTNVDLSSLGTVGMVMVKLINTTGNWYVWHRSLATDAWLILNSTSTTTNITGGATLNSGIFTLSATQWSTGTYVIYAWAHDTDPDGMIQCGTWTDNAGATVTTTLGWEPQFVLIKATSSTTSDWFLQDSMRGLLSGSGDSWLSANTTAAESGTNIITPTPTGFTTAQGGTATWIYLAIRIPNKPPTSGTEVFQPVVYTGTNADGRLVNTGIKTDMVWARQRNDSVLAGMVVGDRLRGQPYLLTGSTAAENADPDSLQTQIISLAGYGTAFSAMNGFWVGNDPTAKLNANITASNHIAYAFKRAPGFMDVVSYTGDAVNNRAINHQLGTVPQLIIIKSRSIAAGWAVYTSENGTASAGKLNSSSDFKIPPGISDVARGGYVSSTTLSTFTITQGWESFGQVNTSGTTYVAYLFATLPGISKVGSYTGNGSTQTINCGFSTGARFVLIKRTDSTGDWAVVDSARGILSGNDPGLRANLASSETTSQDWVDPSSAGFTVNTDAAFDININGATYIYLAIA